MINNIIQIFVAYDNPMNTEDNLFSNSYFCLILLTCSVREEKKTNISHQEGVVLVQR